MTFRDVIWAQTEFRKLNVKRDELILAASEDELTELKSLDEPFQFHSDTSSLMIMGMPIVFIKKGWEVRDKAGNSITR